jgi:tetratricopeptide (TPR) repeat protein
MVMEDEATAEWIAALCRLRRPTLLYAASIVCVDLHDYQIAISLLKLCTTLEPENAAAHLLLAETFMALEQFELALPGLERALTLGKHQEAQKLLASCHASLSDQHYKALS